jgi:hypothetical protein
MGGLLEDEFHDRTLFGLPMVVTTGQYSLESLDTRVLLNVVAYACQECAHIELALVRPQRPFMKLEVERGATDFREDQDSLNFLSASHLT